MTTIEPIHIHLMSGLPNALRPALAGAGLIHVEPDRAEVWVVRADLPPPRIPEHRPAILAVGSEVVADPGWLEEDVDLWVGIEELIAAGAELARRAWMSRLAFRPTVIDAEVPQGWIHAVRALTGADAIAWITPEERWYAGPPGGLEAIWGCRSLLARASRSTIVIPSRAVLQSRFGVSDVSVDAVLAFPIGARGTDGVVILAVSDDGDSWIRSALPVARRAVDAADRLMLGRRGTMVEGQLRQLQTAMGRLMGLISHDLRSPLFALQLGVKVLERQGGASSSVAVLHRAVNSASDLLRRLVEAGRAVLEPPARTTGSADLAEVWARVAREISAQNPETSINGRVGADGAPLRVEADPSTLEALLRTILSNAVLHGPREGSVRVGSEVTNDEVVLRVWNRGRLPFGDLREIEPFEHRANGGLGIQLFIARRLARASGVDLGLRQVDGEVEARLGLKRSR